MPADLCGEIEFEFVVPPENVSRANIEANHKLGLKQSCDDASVLRIIANGPSSLDAPLDGPTLALNGAYNLFMNSGRFPTMWAACDPQGLVADFLPDTLSPETLYLPASKCDPKVFAKLEGLNKRIWDVADYVTTGRPVYCASSITSCSIGLMVQRGWTRFEVWGWDCCFLDGRHHAHEQQGVGVETIEIECDGRRFVTTRTWLAEALDVANKLKPVFDYMGLEIVLKGDGFLKHFLNGSSAVLQP